MGSPLGNAISETAVLPTDYRFRTRLQNSLLAQRFVDDKFRISFFTYSGIDPIGRNFYQDFGNLVINREEANKSFLGLSQWTDYIGFYVCTIGKTIHAVPRPCSPDNLVHASSMSRS